MPLFFLSLSSAILWRLSSLLRSSSAFRSSLDIAVDALGATVAGDAVTGAPGDVALAVDANAEPAEL
jgi:hypothetical protein